MLSISLCKYAKKFMSKYKLPKLNKNKDSWIKQSICWKLTLKHA